MALSAAEEAQTRELLAQEAALLSLASSEPTIISKLGAAKVNLSQLPAASSASDADLLLIRQSSTDKSIACSAIKDYMKPDYATETVRGVVELATTAEAQAGTDTSRAVTPAGLAAYAPVASTTVAGKVELATTAEVQAGTDTTRAVTPAGLASLTATETRSGLIELATDAEAQAMSDAVRALSPARLASAFGGSNQSLSANGYQKLPSGLIIQWGSTGVINNGATVTFPIAFSNACVYVSLEHGPGAVSFVATSVGARTLTNFVALQTYGGGALLQYLAIGY